MKKDRLSLAVLFLMLLLACTPFGTPSPTSTLIPTSTPIPTWTPMPSSTSTPEPTTGSISGKVIDSADGSPISSASISTDPPTSAVTADERGVYSISEVTPGVYTVTAVEAGYTSASVQIAVVAGKTTTTDLHLVPIPEGSDVTATVAPLTTGLVGSWGFDNCDGTDTSGNDYHGTLYGDPLCIDGVVGKALSLDGVDDWCSLQTMPEEAYSFKDFTIALWFSTGYDTLQTLLQASDGHDWGLEGYGITIRSLTDIEAGYRVKYPDKCEMHSVERLEANAWHHVVLVRDTHRQEGLLYVDGQLAASCDDPTPGLLVVPQSYPRIGYGFYAPSSYEKYFDGLIDEVRIYSRALTAREVEELSGSK